MMNVTLANGRQFPAGPGVALLDAASAAGLTLEHGCRTARCGGCKARVTSGRSTVLRDEVSLSADEIADGIILTCARGAESDLALAVDDLGLPPDVAPRVVPARISELQPLAEDVLKVVLRLPPNNGFRFVAGQYVDVTSPAGVKRSYSIASTSAGNVHAKLELHVRRVPGGTMSDWLFTKARGNDLLRLRGPLGTFFLRDVAGRDLVFLATGTGIAPIRSMLLQLAAIPHSALRPASVTLYWGGRTQKDLYIDPTEGADGADATYHPVLSRADAAWTGARGHVQDALLQHVSARRAGAGAEAGASADADATAAAAAWVRTSVYACGSPAMIDSARAALAAAGLPARHFHSDAFVESNDSRATH